MNQDDLFAGERKAIDEANAPLAAKMRPRTFDEFFGQAHLVGPNAAFRKAAEVGKLGSVILWGPPGVGKTTLAEIVARSSEAAFEKVSAVSAGVADLRKAIETAKRRKPRKSILFIDEIHRFSKSQQDAILPFVEDGTITLIGATTENPSFEVNSALLSRARVYVLNSLTDDEIRAVIQRALTDEQRGLGGQEIELDPVGEDALVNLANGDARASLNMLELCVAVADASETATITSAIVESAVQRRAALYDKGGEQHFDLISALHKSVRGSDVDASLYWLARMLDGGEEPLYLARRIVRMATEDIGLADPHALTLTMAAQQAVHFIGMPEGALALAQAVAYLAAAPKSNAIYKAFGAAQADVANSRNDAVPVHLRNAPTKLMKELDYGKGYVYAHDFEGGVARQQNLPDSLAGRVYYVPTDRGQERRIGERMAEWKQILSTRD
ncbi:replication-associated recombination protein A [soil metagenome]